MRLTKLHRLLHFAEFNLENVVHHVLFLSSKTTRSQVMVCDICGKAEVRQRYVSRSYGNLHVSLLVDRRCAYDEFVPLMAKAI